MAVRAVPYKPNVSPPAFADPLPHARRRERQLAWLHAERAQRIGERVREHAADGDDAALTRALGAEGIQRRRAFLERVHVHVRKIGRDGERVVRERTGKKLALVVVDQVLVQHRAQALHDRAVRLPVQRYGNDDAPDVLDADVVEHLDRAGAWVDRDVRTMGAVAVRALAVREAAFGADAGELAQWHGVAVRRPRLILLEAHVFRAAAEPARSFGADAVPQILRDEHDGGAAHHDAARRKGAEAFLHVVGRAVEHAADAIHRHAERVGRDLREDGLEALAVGRRAGVDGERSIAVQHEPRALARTRRAALDIAADADAVVAAVDQLAAELGLLVPAELRQAALERRAVVAAVALALRVH